MLSKRFSSCSIAPFKACGTERGLKNFGIESGLTNNLALVSCIVPNSSLNTDLCLANTLSGSQLIFLIDPQFNLMFLSQFLPNRLGPFPLMI